MTLYEITNGFIGESYVRAYAWAADEAEARALAEAKFRPGRKNDYWENLRIRALFTADAAPFCTNPSDDGWVTDSE